MDWHSLAPVMIPIAVPMFVAFMKSFIPTLDKRWLPVLCPMLGVAADQLIKASGGPGVGPEWGAFLGLAGNGLREIYDQWSGNAEKPVMEVRK